MASDNLLNVDAQLTRFARRETAPGSDETPTLPERAALAAAEAAMPQPENPSYLRGCKAEDTARHIVDDVIPALNGQGRSGRYYGFVTGGVLPVAEWADNVVTRFDQNVQVHLPTQTIATVVEDTALRMLVDLLSLKGEWRGRTMTTGATASNVLGLACGREAVIAARLGGGAEAGPSVGELGLLRACARAGVEEIQVLTSGGHSSLSKAASAVGLGRQAVRELPRSAAQTWMLDLAAVERELQRPGVASIIAISAGEVNTGRFALGGRAEMERLRELADRYKSWIHVDGAFGVFARVLPDVDEYKALRERVDGLDLADSITIDGHKMLNVIPLLFPGIKPYDSGMFLTRTPDVMQAVFVNPNAAYLSSGSPAAIPSPLNIGLENSRRFRALPLYAVLHSEGRPGFAAMVAAMVQLSRRVSAWIRDSPAYELLPDQAAAASRAGMEDIFMSVLFRATDGGVNGELVERINGTRCMYVSGTSWGGQKAVRMAVANWMVDVERDVKVVTSILAAVAEGKSFNIKDV